MKRTDNSDSMLRRLNSLDDPAVAELALGSWLVSPRHGYTHHGIHVGGGRVVHYAGLSRGWRRGPVEIVSKRTVPFEGDRLSTLGNNSVLEIAKSGISVQ